ncbi:MAG: hypothetical protein JWL61_143 [Gemmatimonadetes bacterium]|nr:hypothetical protein [Gemmatimonadota bacterium]
MRLPVWSRAAILLAAIVSTSSPLLAQERAPLPLTRADALLEEGRWAEAEALFYAQSERSSRDPVARAALGRFIAMKGAVRPGMVLIEEARQFGLDAATARELLAPLRAILEWRTAAADLKKDSTLTVRVPAEGSALFQMPLPRTGADGRSIVEPGDVKELVWHDVVDRGVGLDSLAVKGSPMGIEIFEALVPSLNVRTNKLTLHANSRSALSATGRRYQVLRSPREVLVLVGDRRVLPLVEALRELSPSWWQLDLPHGLLVVR